MRRRTGNLLAVALLVPAVLLGACGGDDGGEKAAFEARKTFQPQTAPNSPVMIYGADKGTLFEVAEPKCSRMAYIGSIANGEDVILFGGTYAIAKGEGNTLGVYRNSDEDVEDAKISTDVLIEQMKHGNHTTTINYSLEERDTAIVSVPETSTEASTAYRQARDHLVEVANSGNVDEVNPAIDRLSQLGARVFEYYIENDPIDHGQVSVVIDQATDTALLAASGTFC